MRAFPRSPTPTARRRRPDRGSQDTDRGRSAARRARPRIAATVGVSVAVLTAALATAGPAAALQRPREYKASLVVTGGITTKIRRDTTAECAPGQEWLYTTRSEVNIRRTIRVHAFGPVVGVTARSGPSGGEHTATISGYRETNRCPPHEPAKLEQPSCDSYPLSTMLTSITTGPRRTVILALSRAGRGQSHEEGPCAPPSLTSPDPLAQFSTLGQAGDSVVLPLGPKPKAFYTLGKRRKLISRLRVTGTCDRVTVRHGSVPAPLDPLDDGDCVVDGTFNVEVQRLG